jgi:hypothetical protein
MIPVGRVSLRRRTVGSRSLDAEFMGALAYQARKQGADAVIDAYWFKLPGREVININSSESRPSEDSPEYVAVGTTAMYADPACAKA